jgi:hypothetical protein
MSWVSKFLKKNLGVPEVNLLKIPVLGDQLAAAGRDELLRQIAKLSDEDFARVFEVVAIESARRTKAAHDKFTGKS